MISFQELRLRSLLCTWSVVTVRVISSFRVRAKAGFMIRVRVFVRARILVLVKNGVKFKPRLITMASD